MSNLAVIPELWARQGLMLLNETSIALPTVNRQYSESVSQFGDVVHAHRPGRRQIRRKSGSEGYTAIDTSMDDVPVRLDQIFFDSTIIRDHEMSLSMVDLVERHLVPMTQTIGRGIDRALLGRVHEFVGFGDNTKRVGKLGGMTADNSYDFLLEANEVLNTNLAPAGEKALMVDPRTRTFLKKNDLFVAADQRGDGGRALEGREIGTIDDFRVIMGQNVNHVSAASADIRATAINNGNVAVGSTTLTVDSADLYDGEFFTVAGNDQPQIVTNTGGTSQTSIVANEGLKYTIADGNVVNIYARATVAHPTDGTYAAGWQKEINLTHTSGKNLQVGQLLAFGLDGSRKTYTILERTVVSATETAVLLDRPLDASVADADFGYPGPAGSICATWHQNALALVSRPMAVARDLSGVYSASQSYEGLGLRVTMQYDAAEGGMRVNVDLLAGVAVLDPALGVAVLA